MNYCIISTKDLEMMKKDLEWCIAQVYLDNKYEEVEYTLKVYKMIHILIKELIEDPAEKVFETVVDFFQKDLWSCFQGKDYKEIFEEVDDAYLAHTILKVINIKEIDSEDGLKIINIINLIGEIMDEFGEI